MEEQKESKKESRYLVMITGKNTHFEVPINDLGDFANLDEILRILKKKL